MINSYKYRSNCSSYIIREDHYGASVYGGGGVGPIETCFYSQKDNFVRNRHDGYFQKYQRQHIAPRMDLCRSMYYPVGAYDCSLFGISSGCGRGRVGPRTTHLTSQKVDFWIDGDDFVLSRSREYSSINYQYRDTYYSS